MKNLTLCCLLILWAVGGGCQKTESSRDVVAAQAAGSVTAAKNSPDLPPGTVGGQVIETMDSGGYTYVLVDDGNERFWAAGPENAVAVGQRVFMTRAMVMTDFHSKTLDRTFPEIHFVGSIEVEGHEHSADETAASPHGMPAGSAMSAVGGSRTQPAKSEIEPVAKAEGGYTVAEIYAQRDALAGQPVQVRGRVVKFTPNIMGTNWAHLQDGTGDEQTSDLTMTTDVQLVAGDLVTAGGTLTVDKDFGAGYFYAVIIENASVKKE